MRQSLLAEISVTGTMASGGGHSFSEQSPAHLGQLLGLQTCKYMYDKAQAELPSSEMVNKSSP